MAIVWETIVDDINSIFEDLRDRVQNALNRVQDPGFLHSVWDFLGGVLKKVANLLKEALAKIGEAIATFAEYLSPGNPFLLKSIGSNWNAVKAELTTMTSTFANAAAFRAETSWDDPPASTRYQAARPLSKDALAAVVKHTEAFQKYVIAHANGIIDTWEGVYEKCLTTQADVIREVAAVLGALGSGFTLNTEALYRAAKEIGTLVATIVTFLGDQLRILFERAQQEMNDQDSFESAVSDNSGLGMKGTWPPLFGEA